MNALIFLAVILLILMTLVGGKTGIRSFFALFLNFGVFILTVIVLTIPTISPIIPTMIACIVVGCINLFYVNRLNLKTKMAFFASMLTILLLLGFILIVTKKMLFQGFGEEQSEAIGAFSLFVGVDFTKIGAAMIIMSTVGSITDVAMSIASPMQEMYDHHPDMNEKTLFKAGLTFGRDILGTDTNTLFFAFFGNYLGLLIWFKDLDYPLGKIVNSNVFSSELITILSAGIGVALIIPITAMITANTLVKKAGYNKV